MADILSGFGGFGNVGAGLLKYGALFGLFLLFALAITAIVIVLLVKKNQTRIIEIDPGQRIRDFTGRYKKKKGNNNPKLWCQKIKRFLPQFQQKDLYTKGKKDALVLLKDNNGMYHSLRVPTYKQMCEWYKVQHGIDLEDPAQRTPAMEHLRSVYLMPNPHENLDWLADQVVEANLEYKDLEWWQHPNVMIAVSVGGAVMIQIVNLVILYLMNKK